MLLLRRKVSSYQHLLPLFNAGAQWRFKIIFPALKVVQAIANISTLYGSKCYTHRVGGRLFVACV